MGDPALRPEKSPPGQRSHYLPWIKKDLAPWKLAGGITKVPCELKPLNSELQSPSHRPLQSNWRWRSGTTGPHGRSIKALLLLKPWILTA